MAVLLRKPGACAPLLETALARAGIPAYFVQGTTRPDPAGRAFLTLVDCALEGLSAKRFAEYLAFGQVPFQTPDAEGYPHAGTPIGGAEDEWTPPGDETLGPAATYPLRQVSTASTEVGERQAGIPVEHDQPAPAADNVRLLEGGLRAPWKWEELLVECAVIGVDAQGGRSAAGRRNDWRVGEPGVAQREGTTRRRGGGEPWWQLNRA